MNAMRFGFVVGMAAQVAIGLLFDRETYRRGKLRRSWRNFRKSPIVRRELWEYPAIWMAPSITAGIVFFFFVLVMVVMARPGRVPELPYVIVTSFMLAAMAVVWVFYCLDALHGERRDRSILFWKSLPVSDLTTVLSKAAIPLVVMPFVTFVVTAALQLAL